MSPEIRAVNFDTIEKMSDVDVFEMFAYARWNSTTQQTCPDCGTVASHYWKRTRRQWVCRTLGCSRTFSILSGTKLESSKLPLRKLLRFMLAWVSNGKGISAIQMARQQGMKHQHAYMLMQKFREAIMVTWDYSPLSGLVHVDGSHLIELPKGRPVVLCGDAADLTENLSDEVAPGYCWQENDALAIASIRNLNSIARSENAELWPNHDFEFFNGLPQFPSWRE